MPEYRRTLIVRKGRLVSIPEGLRLLAPSQWLPFLRSPAVSWWGKLRMGLTFSSPPGAASRMNRRARLCAEGLGKEALERIAQPLVAGIYTADPETLSNAGYAAPVPGLRAAIWKRMSRFDAQRRGSCFERPSLSTVYQPKKGFQQLIDALVEQLPPESVRLDYQVQSIRSGTALGGRWFQANRVLLATPTYQAAAVCKHSIRPGRTFAIPGVSVFGHGHLVYPAEAVESSHPSLRLCGARRRGRRYPGLHLQPSKVSGPTPETWPCCAPTSGSQEARSSRMER